MKNGLLGAVAGFILGAVVGTALFGPIGGAVGLVLGTVFGFFIVTPLAVSFVHEAAKHPFHVECPETHRMVEVTLDPEQAARNELFARRQRIATCSRFGGHPDCHENCVGDLEF